MQLGINFKHMFIIKRKKLNVNFKLIFDLQTENCKMKLSSNLLVRLNYQISLKLRN